MLGSRVAAESLQSIRNSSHTDRHEEEIHQSQHQASDKREFKKKSVKLSIETVDIISKMN